LPKNTGKRTKKRRQERLKSFEKYFISQDKSALDDAVARKLAEIE